MKWDYVKRQVELSMDGYVESALAELQHIKPKRPEYAPTHMIRPNYGEPIQYIEEDNSDVMSEDEIRYTQKTIGKFLFYGRAIDNTMLHALNHIATSGNTQKTLQVMK